MVRLSKEELFQEHKNYAALVKIERDSEIITIIADIDEIDYQKQVGEYGTYGLDMHVSELVTKNFWEVLKNARDNFDEYIDVFQIKDSPMQDIYLYANDEEIDILKVTDVEFANIVDLLEENVYIFVIVNSYSGNLTLNKQMKKQLEHLNGSIYECCRKLLNIPKEDADDIFPYEEDLIDDVLKTTCQVLDEYGYPVCVPHIVTDSNGREKYCDPSRCGCRICIREKFEIGD